MLYSRFRSPDAITGTLAGWLYVDLNWGILVFMSSLHCAIATDFERDSRWVTQPIKLLNRAHP
ncbi:hypothetical protein D0Q02_30150 [Micromonospora craniellae]|uniref:Uncharacterized protein n=1 Tax=Micromonospora craniellae TaxID=2294034 RepID=A0A372FQM2_9ACTN|nr:hypothetical protein D0Q02_30150 [Micromonospora craniellae]